VKTKTCLHRKVAQAVIVLVAAVATSLPVSTAFAQDCEVKIGSVGPMTGGGASWGLSMKAGADFEAASVNAAGGLQMGSKKCKVVVVPYDSLQTASGAAAAANFFASQNIHAVNGPVVGPESTGWLPVGKRNGILSFTTTFAANAMSPEFPHAFHMTQGPPIWGPAVVKAAKQKFNFKNAVLVGPNDQGGTDTIKPLQKMYEEEGVKVTAEYYQRGTTNFAAIATRIMSMNADVVDFTGGPPGEMGILTKQLLEAGFTGAFGRLGAGGDVIIKNAGGMAAVKKFFWFDHVPLGDPGIKRLNEDFERVMKTPIPENALWYNSQITVENLLKAISAAGTDQDGDKIAEALRKMTLESRYLGKAGWRGKTQFGINQEFSFPVGVSFINDGKLDGAIRIEIPTE
jgi:branched-chain amino acid transport system substrate-binding protein